MTISKWQRLNYVHSYDAKVFSHYKTEAKNYQGTKQGSFDILECSNWVNIIPITPDEHMIWIRQYRHGTDQITLEIPGGAIDKTDASPLAAAKRELLEETGHTATKWRPLGSIDPNPAFMSNSCSIFLAEGCTKVGPQKLDEMEEIEIELIPLKQVRNMIANGEIRHALVQCGLLLMLFDQQSQHLSRKIISGDHV